MNVIENINLKPYNTFGIEVFAKYFTTVSSKEIVANFVNENIFKIHPYLMLGGGSNILFTQNYNGIIIKNEIDFIDVVEEDENSIKLKVGSGVNWHQFVLHCVHHQYAGVENLSLIPGCVGACPIQNIGAYGVEVKDIIDEVEFFDIEQNKFVVFKNKDCAFGYRDSIFKKELHQKIFIVAVTFLLQKKATFNTSYGAIETELQKMNVTELNIKAISDAVINIRSSKLPDPKIIGNAGSFFKNPTIPIADYVLLKEKYPAIVGYPNKDNTAIKLAAGWLIEQSGLKGVQVGQTGCHKLQALVLVNYGNATGKEIYDYSSRVIEKVSEKFGVYLEREVNIV